MTRALKSLPVRARVGLTGTALQNKYEELWCLLDWANPGCLGSMDHFKAEFSQPMVRGFRQDASREELAIARRQQAKFNALKKDFSSSVRLEFLRRIRFCYIIKKKKDKI